MLSSSIYHWLMNIWAFMNSGTINKDVQVWNVVFDSFVC